MGLTADIGLRGIMLGVQRVKVLLKPMVGRDPGVDGAANRLGRHFLHGSRLRHAPQKVDAVKRLNDAQAGSLTGFW
jgi:hypothetical protein